MVCFVSQRTTQALSLQDFAVFVGMNLCVHPPIFI